MRDEVREYYGKTLGGTGDLQTDACCDTAPPPHLKRILEKLHPEVVARYYGCGLVAPAALDGTSVLDLGCGSGRDCYLLSSLVGENGSVTGVDMTVEQLAVATRHLDYHRQQFGYANSNVRFLQGYIEELDKLELPDNAFDVVVSNCVVNLSPDKKRVFSEVHRVLKPGGEFYFSDVYADRRVPEVLRRDPVLYGECLAGALYWNDFLSQRLADLRIRDWLRTVPSPSTIRCCARNSDLSDFSRRRIVFSKSMGWSRRARIMGKLSFTRAR